MWQRRLITVFVIFLLITSFVVGSAQDEVPAETTPEVTQEPVVLEEPPAPEITEEPTVAPTEEPATPEATEESPTEAPQEGGEPPTPEVTNEPGTQEPAPVSAPPVFEIATSLSVTAGQSISIPFAIYDEQGAVVLTEMVSAAGSQTTLEIVAPIQVSPPYATTGTITYTASISDSLTLTAVDGTGLSASVTIQIDVQPAPEATAEATPEVTPEITQEPGGNLIERIISYDPAASEQAVQDMLAALHATEISRIPQLGSMKVLMPELLVSVAQTMAESNSAPAGLSGLEENVMYELFFTPNDPAFNNGTNQWALTDYTGSTYTMYAWDIAKQDGAGVLVAVLDTGVDLQHPDLAGQIDTARDWDFINDDNNADDDHDPSVGIGGHGTHVAGIIAAKTNNALYMAGIAYRAKILPVKVCTANTGCPTYEIAAGIVYAVDQGAKIINLSLGAPTISTTIRGAVEYALARNVTVVAAAGNAGTTVLQYPASYPGVISVASHDINGVIVSNSSHNTSVTISAPGYAVYSLARVDFIGGGERLRRCGVVVCR
jgi:subtilisin family serine protease